MPSLDLTKCKTIDDILNATNAELSIYDETPVDDGEYALKLNPYLTEEEIDDARFWYHFSRGILLIHGPPGSGKGVVGNMIIKKMAWYYDKNILLDYMPRRLFAQEWMPSANDIKTGFPIGEPILVRERPYVPFGTKQLIEQLARMSDVALGDLNDESNPDITDIEKKHAKEIQRLSGEWLSGQGQVFLKYAVLGLDEMKRYHDKRRPHNPFGLLLDDVYNIYRHLDLLIVGMSAYYDELDEMRFLPKVNYEIRCSWASTLKHTSIATLFPKVQINSDGVRAVLGKKIPMPTDGRMPREVLGNYVVTKLAKDIDVYDKAIQLESTEKFTAKKGVCWIENEYVGYESMENSTLQNCIRGLNRKRNKCRAVPHKKGAMVMTGKGWFDIYNSWNAISIVPPKSLRG